MIIDTVKTHWPPICCRASDLSWSRPHLRITVKAVSLRQEALYTLSSCRPISTYGLIPTYCHKFQPIANQPLVVGGSGSLVNGLCPHSSYTPQLPLDNVCPSPSFLAGHHLHPLERQYLKNEQCNIFINEDCFKHYGALANSQLLAPPLTYVSTSKTINSTCIVLAIIVEVIGDQPNAHRCIISLISLPLSFIPFFSHLTPLSLLSLLLSCSSTPSSLLSLSSLFYLLCSLISSLSLLFLLGILC